MNEITVPFGAMSPARSLGYPGPRIVADRVSKSYETPTGTKHVLKDISFSIGRGEKMAVLGRRYWRANTTPPHYNPDNNNPNGP